MLPLSGTVTLSEALARFRNSNVILIAALFSLRAAGVNLLAIDRGSRLATETETIRLPAQTELRADDILLVDVVATVAEKLTLMDRYKVDVLPLGDDPGYLTDAHDGVGMAEAMLSPESSLIGHTVLQARIRSEQGLTVIGLRRGGEPDPDRWYDPVLCRSPTHRQRPTGRRRHGRTVGRGRA